MLRENLAGVGAEPSCRFLLLTPPSGCMSTSVVARFGRGAMPRDLTSSIGAAGSAWEGGAPLPPWLAGKASTADSETTYGMIFSGEVVASSFDSLAECPVKENGLLSPLVASLLTIA